MSSQNAIGVFDSGLGGLTAVKEFMHVLPNEKIIYFGDTGRVPYGTKSRDTIKKYSIQDTNFLLSHNVKMIVAACGTVSSVAGKMLEQRLGVPYTGVVNPTVFTAVKVTENGQGNGERKNRSYRNPGYRKQSQLPRPNQQAQPRFGGI